MPAPWPLALAVAVEIALLYTSARRLEGVILWRAQAGRRARWAANVALGPGTVLHESCHALAALALGGRIGRFVAFRGVRAAQTDGRHLLGYVQFSLPSRSRVAVALVGMAPLWLGAPVLYGALELLLVGTGPSGWTEHLADHPARTAAALACLALGSLGLVPSGPDHEGAWILAPLIAVTATVAVMSGAADDLLGVAAVILALPALAVSGASLMIRR